MVRLNSVLGLLLVAFFSVASAWDINDENDRQSCQSYSKNPLDGCHETNSIFVDIVGGKSKYQTVQSGRQT